MIKLKTSEEIKILQEGGKLLAQILDELETLVVPGNTTLDIDDRAMELIEQHSLEPMTLGYQPDFAARPYPAATCVSINDAVVHGIPNEEPVEFISGDLVSIDMVIAHKGLVVDSARTVGTGKLSPEAASLIRVTALALEAGIKAAQPGNKVRDIGTAVSAAVPDGYGVIEAFCGHGVGYDLHESPMVPNFPMPGASPELEEGLVIAIEPMITLGSKEVEVLPDGYTVVTKDGSLSAHMEHSVAITKTGPLVLTRSRR